MLKKMYAVDGRLGAFGSLGSVRLRFTPLEVGVASSKTSEASSSASSVTLKLG